MLMARVKEKSAQPIIVACTGRQYVKTEWRQVPAGMEKEANAQPNLVTQTDAQLNPQPKTEKKAKPKAKGKAKAKAKEPNAGPSEAKGSTKGDSKAPPEDEAKAEKEVAKGGE